VLCQSVIADELEIATSILNVVQTVKSRRFIIVSAVMSDYVTKRVASLVEDRLGSEIKVIALGTLDADLRVLRDAMSDNLDDRTDRYAPLMSEWLVHRAFGP